MARPRRVRAYIGLGANVGDPRATLTHAVRALAALPGARLAGVSRLYRTRPVGVTAQPQFLNAAAALDVPAGRDPESGALALLLALKGLERAFGRQDRPRWGPRELDLDLLVFGRHAIVAEGLAVPHPVAPERLFVLAPLRDLAAALRPPGWGETVESAFRRRLGAEGEGAAKPIGDWDAAGGYWSARE